MTGSSQLLHFSCALANGAKSHLFPKANCHLGWNDISPLSPPPPLFIISFADVLLTRPPPLVIVLDECPRLWRKTSAPSCLARSPSIRRAERVVITTTTTTKERKKEKKYIKSALAAHFSSFHIRAAGAHRQKLNICCCPCCSQGRRLWCHFNLAGFSRRSG